MRVEIKMKKEQNKISQNTTTSTAITFMLSQFLCIYIHKYTGIFCINGLQNACHFIICSLFSSLE